MVREGTGGGGSDRDEGAQALELFAQAGELSVEHGVDAQLPSLLS